MRTWVTVKKSIRILSVILTALMLILLIRAWTSKNQPNCQHVTASDLYRYHLPACLKQSNLRIRLPSVCLNESCRSDYVELLQSADVYPIPAIRHILWKSEVVSKHFAKQLRTWQSIHPDWTFVLWRDQDLEPFVATHFPCFLAKFKSLEKQIMKVDMIRYMILLKYGGTYADLDYSLVRRLDSFRRFHAVITREPESHSLQFQGIAWPVKLLANPAFMMSAPGHIFHTFALLQLESRPLSDTHKFAGPIGLSDIVNNYQTKFPIAKDALETVYVPPSYSFYPYPDNRMNTSKSGYLQMRYKLVHEVCEPLISGSWSMSLARWLKQQQQPDTLVRYCTDVNNMDLITDRTQPVFAVHDLVKSGAVYDGTGAEFYNRNLTDVRDVIRNLKLGKDFMAL